MAVRVWLQMWALCKMQNSEKISHYYFSTKNFMTFHDHQRTISMTSVIIFTPFHRLLNDNGRQFITICNLFVKPDREGIVFLNESYLSIEYYYQFWTVQNCIIIIIINIIIVNFVNDTITKLWQKLFEIDTISMTLF